MKEIKVEELSLRFGKKDVLKKVCFTVKKGEFITIAGPNGSGKTTLLRSICNQVKADGGSVFIDDINLFSIKAKERARLMSVVPQNTDVTYEFSCFDVVMMGRYPHIGRLKGETLADREKVNEAMDLTKVGYLKDRLFTEISGGERQRVVLAQAIAQEADIILLDEPISNLDPQYQTEILDTIKELSIEKGITVIAVLHDLNMASMYSDRVMLMKLGSVFSIGAPEEVLTKGNIKDVFGADVLVSNSPVINKPHIFSKSRGFFSKPREKIHIICGGGSGSQIIHELYHLGYIISVCVLNEGDMDWRSALDYKLEMVVESPFCSISDESYNKNLKNIKDAETIVICPTYFSEVNIRNLTVLLEKDIEQKNICFLESENFEERDFTGGEASRILEILAKRKNCKKGFCK